MKNRSTYALLVQSEEKSRNIMETALYALFALSAVVSIWQFVQ
jgi:ABC-type sugar transport system permease subunit